jgi:hypothetical protein
VSAWQLAWIILLAFTGFLFGSDQSDAQGNPLQGRETASSIEPLIGAHSHNHYSANVTWEPFGAPPKTELETDDQRWWRASSSLPPRPPAAQPGTWRSLVRETSFSGTWLGGGSEDGLGIAELKASTTLIIPVRVFGSPLLVTPSFGSSLLDCPASMDIPSELYRVSGSMMWLKQHSDRMNFMIGATPGVASDFEATENAFRIVGFGAAKYQWTPTTELMLGVAYLDRDDIPILPMAGLIWIPDEDTRLELTLPRPRRMALALGGSRSRQGAWRRHGSSAISQRRTAQLISSPMYLPRATD